MNSNPGLFENFSLEVNNDHRKVEFKSYYHSDLGILTNESETRKKNICTKTSQEQRKTVGICGSTTPLFSRLEFK
jgi:hypothetical protein